MTREKLVKYLSITAMLFALYFCIFTSAYFYASFMFVSGLLIGMSFNKSMSPKQRFIIVMAAILIALLTIIFYEELTDKIPARKSKISVIV